MDKGGKILQAIFYSRFWLLSFRRDRSSVKTSKVLRFLVCCFPFHFPSGEPITTTVRKRNHKIVMIIIIIIIIADKYSQRSVRTSFTVWRRRVFVPDTDTCCIRGTAAYRETTRRPPKGVVQRCDKRVVKEKDR